MKKNFIPLLFAADINVYSVARAFHEEYGIKTYAIGKAAPGTMPLAESSIINYTANPKADVQETFLELVLDFCRESICWVLGCWIWVDTHISQFLQTLASAYFLFTKF